MPHQCTNCERVFPDGSKEMLSGCPDCGGNKFQFKPDSATPTPTLGDDSASSEPSRSEPSQSDVSTPDGTSTPDSPSTPTESTDTTSSSADDEDFIEAESDPSVLDDPEDTAQADARRSVATRDELDHAGTPDDLPTDDAARVHPPEDSSTDDAARVHPPEDSSTDDAARVHPPDDPDSPGIDDLREELNDQFESIKILEPGQYELNLMELYDRQECIISLQEDGHYVIEVADTWRDDGA